MFFLRDVIALFIKHLKDELEKRFQSSNINLTATDFHWVITVPAIWSASRKQMMREAAYQVNDLISYHTSLNIFSQIMFTNFTIVKLESSLFLDNFRSITCYSLSSHMIHMIFYTTILPVTCLC